MSQSRQNTHGACRSCAAIAVFAINATIVTHNDFYRSREVNIEIVRGDGVRWEPRCCWCTIALGLECFSAGSSWFYVTVKALIFHGHDEALRFDSPPHPPPPLPCLILSQQSRAWDRLVRWRCEKRSVRVLPESNGSQTHSQAYLHEADSAEWKISGNYRLVVDLLAQESQKKKKSHLRVNRWFISLPD